MEVLDIERFNTVKYISQRSAKVPAHRLFPLGRSAAAQCADEWPLAIYSCINFCAVVWARFVG